MTTAELLQATGNVWEVVCYKDGNRRCCLGRYYVRSNTQDGAKQAALRLSRGKVATAWPWNPAKDLQASAYIRAVPDITEEGGNQ
jgi:hypothetical protein